ncbi:MAG: oligosaccharyl transferase, archaeosortase A system-associated [Chloroflexota bacterium]|nr:oligosaccharyl transferase, archaeosortase A system-associated [Chloroflexota bacterium]
MSTLLAKTIQRVPPKAVYGILMLLIFGIALSLRLCPPYDSVFGGDWVRFGMTDSWYHIRLAENLAQHFPQRIGFDPFTWYPFGQGVYFAPFFDLLLGLVIWVAGLGTPTQHTVEVVAAYFPAVLGALATVPVYFVGKTLFNRTVGLLSAGLIAILPGEFLLRSVLGVTDHHMAEVLFSTLVVLFLLLAMKAAREQGTRFEHVWRREWRSLAKPLAYSVLAGICLGLYFASWVGAVLFLVAILVFAVVQYAIDHVSGKSTDYLCIVGAPCVIVALIVVLPFRNLITEAVFQIPSLLLGVLVFAVLSGLSKLMVARRIRPGYYPLALAVAGLAGLGVFYAVAPDLLTTMASRFGIFVPEIEVRTIAEANPLLSTFGEFSLELPWSYFTTGFFIAFVSLLLIAYAAVKERNAGKTLLVIWSLAMLAATLGQRRFAYYYAVNVALLAGYLAWRVPAWTQTVLGWIGLREKAAPRKPIAEVRKKKAKGSKKKRARQAQPSGSFAARYLKPRYVSVVLGGLMVFFGVFYPNIGLAIATAESVTGPNEAWHDSLLWMRDNTPDPFQDPGFYYELYQSPPAGESYDYPESAYGIMCWWDYGHWITQMAHRIPCANPHQLGAPDAALFFIAQDEQSGNEVMDRLGCRYVIIDFEQSVPKFNAMLPWAGETSSLYFEEFYRTTTGGRLEPALLFYPEYYRSMCSRLYNFGGQEVVPDNSTYVVRFEFNTDSSGRRFKEITDFKTFATYQEAEDFVGTQSYSGYRIVGTNPYVSPVPLEALEHYKVVYESELIEWAPGDTTLPYVRILEYAP